MMAYAIKLLRGIRMPCAAPLLAAALLFGPSSLEAGPTPGALIHKPAPEFARSDIHGSPIDLASFRGQVVLLSFWATWCAPCQIEMPHFVRWQQELGARGLQILAISMDDDAAPVLGLTRRRHVNYPVIMGDEQLGRLYGGVLGLPVTFLIDREGNVAAVFKGTSSLRTMRAQILKAVATRRPTRSECA